MPAISCTVKYSERPCYVRTESGGYGMAADGLECWRTGKWCETASPLVPDGSRPSVPHRYAVQLQHLGQGLLPHDIDAEEAVLGSILICNEMIEDVGELKPGDFYREQKNGWVFETMQRLHKRGVGINQITVAHELKESGRLNEIGGPSHLSNCISRVPTPFDCRYFADIVRSCAERRRLIEAGGKLAAEGFEGSGGKKGFKGFDI